MKSILKKSLIIGLAIVAIACAKSESADPGGGGGGGQTPNNCLPDQFGSVPPGCPVPSTASVGLTGDILLGSDLGALPIMKDMAGTLERPWGVGSFYNPPIRCGTNDGIGGIFTGQYCERECKNYRGGASLNVQITSGNGVVRFRAGPYRAPGGCNRSMNNSYYTVQMPVWIYNTNGNRGFAIRSAPSHLNGGTIYNYPGTGGWNKIFSIEVEEGTLSSSQSSYTGKVFYNNNFIGSVQLYRR